jgi:haloalkane dehalogenase
MGDSEKLSDAGLPLIASRWRLAQSKPSAEPQSWPTRVTRADVVAIVQAYADWLSQSEVPKLFVNAAPGAILVGAQREFCRGWPNQTEVTVEGSHFIQEDSPDQIGRAIAEWLSQLS